MDAVSVDPRLIDQEVDHPIYWVVLWQRAVPDVEVPRLEMGFHSDEYEIKGARNVLDAFSWADANANSEQTFSIYVIVDGVRVRLFGKDPTQWWVAGESNPEPTD